MEVIKVLLVEDELVLAGVLKETLALKGFEVCLAANGLEGFSAFKEFRPDICIVDIMMPKKDGISMVKEIRTVDQQTPLIFLTAKSETQDVIQGFHVGADDYIKKPFSIEELILRMQALLKRSKQSAGSVAMLPGPNTIVSIGQYRFDYNRLELHLDKEIQRLSQREADILKMLTDNLRNITPRKDILLQLWGDDSFFNARNMDVYISRLRKFLSGDEKVQIINVRGKGIKLVI